MFPQLSGNIIFLPVTDYCRNKNFNFLFKKPGTDPAVENIF